MVNTGHYTVGVFERTAGYGTTSARYHVLRLGKLLIQTTEHRRHAMHNRALHHYIVGLTG